MSAILRNNAARVQSGVGKAELKGGGEGRWEPTTGAPRKVRPKVRYSHDPAQELMPAAEFLGHDPDFAAILEDFRDSPFDPRRRKVLGKLMGIFAVDYQGARAEERAFLRRLLAARNAKEGYAANWALHLGGAGSVIRRTLALGVAESRFADGSPFGFLGAVQARVADTTFRLLGPKGREQVWNLLVMAGTSQGGERLLGSDPVIERALILKAVAARRHLLGPWSADGDAALNEINTFAGEIRGCWRVTLAARTTLRSGDPMRAAADLPDPGSVERAALEARGEIDPVFAWQTHAVGVEATPQSANAYEDVFDAIPEVDRTPLLDRPRLHLAFAEARASGFSLMPKGQVAVLESFLSGAELTQAETTVKDRALERLQQRGFDVVRPQSLVAIREDARGLYKFDAAEALTLLLSRYTGAAYVRRLFSDQITAGSNPVEQILSSLDRGLAVPVTIKDARTHSLRAFGILAHHEQRAVLEMRDASLDVNASLPAGELVQPVLPRQFGRKGKADTYLAPAALDLLAAPFGIPFPGIGLEDAL